MRRITLFANLFVEPIPFGDPVIMAGFSYKMNELFEIADGFSVFRDGKYIATKLSSEVTRDDIIKMMGGREITQMFSKLEVPIGKVVLSVKNLCLDGSLQRHQL